MKLTKGMKKALSLLLTSALVLTGANFSGMKADAADADKTAVWEGELHANKTEDPVYVNTTTTDTFGDAAWVTAHNTWAGGDAGSWSGANLTATMDLSSFVEPTVEIKGRADEQTTAGVEIAKALDDGGDWLDTVKKDVESGDFTITETLNKSEEAFMGIAPKADSTVHLTSIKVYDAKEGEADPSATESASSGGATAEPSGEPSGEPGGDTPAPGQSFEPVDVTPVDGCDYTAEVIYSDNAWNYNTMADQLKADVEAGKATIPNTKIVGNGTYSITLPAEFLKPYLSNADAEGAEGASVFTVDIQGILLKDATVDASKMTVKDIMISLDGQLIAVDQEKVLKGDIEEKGNYRLEFYNSYGETKNASPIDVKNFKWKESMEITFTVEGLAAKSGSVESPAPSASVQPTAPATGTSTTGTSATGTAASGTAATKKLTVAKKSVVVAAGKSVKVKYTVTKTAAASKAAAVTVKSANKKIAKVSKVSGKKQIKISVPKKATKGASTKITLKSGNKTAKVTVKVQNKVKKVKAAKKTLTVKKGKKAKATFKVTAANKKKATTDKVTVKFSKKVAKKVKTAVKKGKVIVTVKGLKKGKSAKMTVKVGKKSAKMTVKVK